MKDRMDLDVRRELESVDEIADFLEYFVWANIAVIELLGLTSCHNVPSAEPDFVSYGKLRRF